MAITGQLKLDFEPGLSKRYRKLREVVAASVYKHSLQNCAAASDQAPSNFSQALNGDGRNFDIDWLEATLEQTKDYSPILYLIDKFLHDKEAQKQAAISQLGSMLPQLTALLREAGVQA